MGLEPTRAEPNGLTVHRLNHSATSSTSEVEVRVEQKPASSVELGKQILSQNSTGKYSDIGHTSFLRLLRFRSVVVITCA